MPTTIKITKYESGFANVPPQYAVGDDDDGSSHLVSCKDYILPDEFKVAESNLMGPQIYDMDNNHYEIVHHSSGRPQIVGASNKMPVLREAKESD